MAKNKYVVIDRASASAERAKMQKNSGFIAGRAIIGTQKPKKNPKGYHPILVPALDTLIGDPRILEPEEGTDKKADYLYIPSQFIRILGGLRTKRPAYRGEAAAKILEIFSNYLTEIQNNKNADFYTCKNGMVIRFIKKR